MMAATMYSLYTETAYSPKVFTLHAANNSYRGKEAVALGETQSVHEVFFTDEELEAGVQIDKIAFLVDDFEGATEALISGDLKFASTGTSVFKTLGVFNKINLEALEDTGKEVTVQMRDELAVQELMQLIKSKRTVC